MPIEPLCALCGRSRDEHYYGGTHHWCDLSFDNYNRFTPIEPTTSEQDSDMTFTARYPRLLNGITETDEVQVTLDLTDDGVILARPDHQIDIEMADHRRQSVCSAAGRGSCGSEACTRGAVRLAEFVVETPESIARVVELATEAASRAVPVQTIATEHAGPLPTEPMGSYDAAHLVGVGGTVRNTVDNEVWTVTSLTGPRALMVDGQSGYVSDGRTYPVFTGTDGSVFEAPANLSPFQWVPMSRAELPTGPMSCREAALAVGVGGTVRGDTKPTPTPEPLPLPQRNLILRNAVELAGVGGVLGYAYGDAYGDADGCMSTWTIDAISDDSVTVTSLAGRESGQNGRVLSYDNWTTHAGWTAVRKANVIPADTLQVGDVFTPTGISDDDANLVLTYYRGQRLTVTAVDDSGRFHFTASTGERGDRLPVGRNVILLDRPAPQPTPEPEPAREIIPRTAQAAIAAADVAELFAPDVAATLRQLAIWLPGGEKNIAGDEFAQRVNLCGEYETVVCPVFGWRRREGTIDRRAHHFTDMLVAHEAAGRTAGLSNAEILAGWTEHYERGGNANQAVLDHADNHLEDHKKPGLNAFLEDLGWDGIGDVEPETQPTYEVEVSVQERVIGYRTQYVTVTVEADDEDEAQRMAQQLVTDNPDGYISRHSWNSPEDWDALDDDYEIEAQDASLQD